MATTLRLNEILFREAKAEAARTGVTLTRFIEDSLRQRLGHKTRAANLPVFDTGLRMPKDFDLTTVVRNEESAYAQRVAEKVPPYGKPSP